MAHSAWTGGSVYTGQAALPHKNIHLDKYEAGLDAPYEDLSDIDNLSDEEQSAMITEYKKRISNVYNKIQKERETFMKTVG